MYKLLNTSLAIALAATLFGCGGSTAPTDGDNDRDTLKDISIDGKAIDGYLRYSTVCLDLNGDSFCQPNEPYTLTDVDGKFSFKVTKEQQEKNPKWSEKNIVAFGGQDSDTGANFSSVVIAPYEKGLASINVTPITTIVAKLKDSGVSQSEAEEKVAKLLDVDVKSLKKDPIQEAKDDPKVLKAALQLQKTVDLLVEAKKEESAGTADAKIADEVLNALVEGLKESELGGNEVSDKLKDVVTKAKTKDALKNVDKIDEVVTKVEVITKGIDEAIDEESFKQADNKDIEKKIQIAAINIHQLKDEIKDANKTELEDIKDNNIFDNLNIVKVTKDNIELVYLKNLIKSLDVRYDDGKLNDLLTDLKNAKVDIAKLNYQTLKTTLEKKSLKDKYNALYNALSKELVEINDKKDEADITQSNNNIAMNFPLKWYELDDVRDGKLYLWIDSFENGTVSGADYEVDLSTKSMTKDNDDSDDKYTLENGTWVEAPQTYSVSNDSKVITVDKYKANVVLKSVIDLSGKSKDIIIDGLSMPLKVKFSSGAKQMRYAYKINETGYVLDDPQRTHGNMGSDYGEYYKTLKDLIKGQSGNRWFDEVGDEHQVGIAFEKEYDGELNVGASGKLIKLVNLHSGGQERQAGIAGSWKVEKIPNSDIVILALYYNKDLMDDHDDVRFYTIYDGKVYEGYKNVKMNSYRTFSHPTYNEKAINDIIDALSDGYGDGLDTGGIGVGGGGMDPNPPTTQITNDGEKFTKEWLNGKTLYNVYFEDDENSWKLSTFRFTDTTWSAEQEGSDKKLNNIPYTITDEGYITFTAPWEEDKGKIEYIKIASKNQDSLRLCWSDSKSNMDQCVDNEYFFFDETKAKTFVDSSNRDIVANSETVTISGKVTFKDQDGNVIPVPNDAAIRITSDVDESNHRWENGFNIKINSDGTFSKTKSQYKNTYNSEHKFQVVVYKNNIEPDKLNWNRDEDVYKFVGGDVAFDGWKDIVVEFSDSNQDNNQNKTTVDLKSRLAGNTFWEIENDSINTLKFDQNMTKITIEKIVNKQIVSKTINITYSNGVINFEDGGSTRLEHIEATKIVLDDSDGETTTLYVTKEYAEKALSQIQNRPIDITLDMIKDKTFYYEFTIPADETTYLGYGKRTFNDDGTVTEKQLIFTGKDFQQDFKDEKNFSSSYSIKDGKVELKTPAIALRFTLREINNNELFIEKEFDRDKDGKYEENLAGMWYLSKPEFFPPSL